MIQPVAFARVAAAFRNAADDAFVILQHPRQLRLVPYGDPVVYNMFNQN